MSNRTLALSSLVIAIAIPSFIVVYGTAAAAGMPPSAQADPRLAMAFFSAHPAYVEILFVIAIVMHLAVIVLGLGLYPSLAPASPSVSAIGLIGAVAWAVLDIAQSSVTYAATLATTEPEAATVGVVANGMQNAAHLFGGVWVLSVAVSGSGVFGRAHRAMAGVVGAVFALHAVVVPVVPAWWVLEYVGLPLFFAWTALAVARHRRRGDLAPVGLQPQHA